MDQFVAITSDADMQWHVDDKFIICGCRSVLSNQVGYQFGAFCEAHDSDNVWQPVHEPGMVSLIEHDPVLQGRLTTRLHPTQIIGRRTAGHAGYAIGRASEAPAPPLNLVGDFGGGGMLLAVGVLAAMLEAQKSGKGQVVDAAMIDGVSALMAALYGLRAAGAWTDNREDNYIDGGAHFYNVYETSDGKFVSIASVEAKFYDELIARTDFDDPDRFAHGDRTQWKSTRQRLADVFRSKTRDEWCETLEGSDVCFAPVLTMDEAPSHPHNVARKTFINVDGVTQPGPAPRFSRTKSTTPRPPSRDGEDTDDVLMDWGLDQSSVERLKDAGVIPRGECGIPPVR